MSKRLPIIGSWANGAYMMLFILLAGLFIWVVGGWIGLNLPSINLPLTVTGGVGAGVGGQVTTTGACPSTGQNVINVKASYEDPTNGNLDTLVATNYYVYRMSDPTTVAESGTTSTGGYQTVNATVNCGDTARVFLGNGGTNYYYAMKELSGSETNSANSYVALKLKRSSAATGTMSNTTTMGASSVGVAIGSGETNSDVTIKVKAGSYYYGDGAFEICARYDTSNFTKVSFGADATPIATDPSLSTTTGTQISCYEVGKQLYNNNYVELPVVIQAKSGVNPTATNITIFLNDKTCYLKNGVCTPSYVNTDTNADLGLSVVTLSDAVQVD